MSPPTPQAPEAHDPYSALRNDAYRRYALGSLFWTIGQQITGVTVQWQVYELTRSETALGLLGLVQALPIIFLAIPAGHVADRFNRKRIVMAMVAVVALTSLILAVVSHGRVVTPDLAPLRAINALLAATAASLGETDAVFVAPIVPLLMLCMFAAASAHAFSSPARHALLPQIVPLEHFGNAVTWQSTVFQTSSVAGPAIGGALIAILAAKIYGLSVIYTIDTLCALVLIFSLWGVRYRPARRASEPMTFATLGAGVRFVFSRRIILATITLDLFAVLLGGAMALLPVYARDILGVGPVGLGLLRAAPAVGAVLTAVVLAHRAPMKRPGVALLWSVAGFGAATIVFGLSQNALVSLVALALTGAFDNISVVVRHTLVQVLTPDAMRGRVSAVNNVFIGSSNELGALESGLVSAAFGPIFSVVSGGIGTILVVVAVALIWPEVRKLGPLNQAHRDAG